MIVLWSCFYHKTGTTQGECAQCKQRKLLCLDCGSANPCVFAALGCVETINKSSHLQAIYAPSKINFRFSNNETMWIDRKNCMTLKDLD